jgi:DNA-directed RNA polymerase specialized sigma24 family protein
MTRDEALGLLPEAHRSVLEWIAEGHDHDDIANRLGVDRAAVAPLVVVAHRKLDRLVQTPTPAQQQGEPNA